MPFSIPVVCRSQPGAQVSGGPRNQASWEAGASVHQGLFVFPGTPPPSLMAARAQRSRAALSGASRPGLGLALARRSDTPCGGCTRRGAELGAQGVSDAVPVAQELSVRSETCDHQTLAALNSAADTVRVLSSLACGTRVLRPGLLSVGTLQGFWAYLGGGTS